MNATVHHQHHLTVLTDPLPLLHKFQSPKQNQDKFTKEVLPAWLQHLNRYHLNFSASCHQFCLYRSRLFSFPGISPTML